MEKPIQRVQGIERVNIFGVRHLSPSASYHLLKYLNRINPKCVLIEGPSDAGEILTQITAKGVKPPIAILAYTTELPVDTILFPLAEYSPEYQAIVWAGKKTDARFIDLPSDILLSLNKWQRETQETETDNETISRYYEQSDYIYTKVAALNGALSYDDYFERHFEHNLNPDSFNTVLKLHSGEIREILEPMEFSALPQSNARGFVREAFMVMQIEKAINDGFLPEEIVVITGAYHADKLTHTIPLTCEELKMLPRRESKMTLMPYSFYRLTTRSGYGSGNNAPAYYQLMWECMKKERLEDLPAEYVSRVGQYIREKGGYCGTSNTIEAVRLARGLTYLKEGCMPALADLHDAIITCMGHGERSEVINALAMMDVGVAFGELPEGISQTPIQDDMYREMKRLKLDKYKTTVSAELTLDLRENIRVKSEEAAFIDLNRSTFLHRLRFLGIGFATKNRVKQEDATWCEIWTLQWTPEVEIQVVESVLKGETIELAAAFLLKEQLADCTDVFEASKLISAACICKLTKVIEAALSTLQKLTADANNFISTAESCGELSALIQYGDIRRFDTEPLVPLLKQLFLRASLLLTGYAGCDDKEADQAASTMNILHNVSQENFDIVDDDTWKKELFNLAARDDKNAKLSGLAFAILLERALIDEDFCAKEVSRRLSPGIPADIGAGWFEGMSMRNRYALLSRTGLWIALDNYIAVLDDDEFKRSVVFMRRAFSSFEPKEKNAVAELLGDIWGLDAQEVSILLQAPLDETETEALAELADMDFDF